MEYRTLGKTGLRTSVIGFGCNRIASRDSERTEVIATLENALDIGMNLIDTADSYDNGESEKLVGAVVRGRRDRVLLCSKAGYHWWGQVLLEKWLPFYRFQKRRIKTGERRPREKLVRRSLKNFSPAILSLSVEGSLRRLQTDYLDFFYLHSPPPEVLAESRTFDALEKLKHKGMIRYYGVSFAERTPTDHILETLQNHKISILQFQFNPAECIDIARIAARPSCEVGMVARQPFQRGALLGTHPGAETVKPARRAQEILRSVLQQPGIHSVLVGMRSRKHLQENLSALNTPPVSSEELKLLYSAARIY